MSPVPVPQDATAGDSTLEVREMRLSEVGIRIDYFHDATDDHLLALGVERALLPTREEWLSFYEEDDARAINARLNYSLLWLLDDEVIGFSSTDRIDFGHQAFMHLHIIEPELRRKGHGTELVKMSARCYFSALELERLYCEPNAFNTAPNRTLQSAGFHYVLTHEAQPSSINFLQITNRWALDRSDLPYSPERRTYGFSEIGY
jgi:RimJ/RimL family protein N-acetyltransferase